MHTLAMEVRISAKKKSGNEIGCHTKIKQVKYENACQPRRVKTKYRENEKKKKRSLEIQLASSCTYEGNKTTLETCLY